MVTETERVMAIRVSLWDEINKYVVACGGDASRHVYGNTTRQRAVAAIERLVFGCNEPLADDPVLGLAIREAARINRVGGIVRTEPGVDVNILAIAIAKMAAELAALRSKESK